MILWLYRFVRGYLVLTLRGRNCARFLNLCAGRQIATWNLTVLDRERISVCVFLSDFYKLRPLLKKTRVRLLIQQRVGLPFVIHRYQKRVVFVGTFLAMAVCLVFLSTRIWRIEVVGNSSLGEETILEYLKQQGISYGAGRNDIDNDALELSLRQDFEPVIWASVYETGTRLTVRIQEKLAAEKETAVSQDPCTDLAASQDAVIYSIITRSGTPLVKAGDTVKSGDLLVSGRQEILDDNGEVKEYFYQSADADILGYVTLPYEDSVPLERVVSERTGKVHRSYFLRVSGIRLSTPKLFAGFDCSESCEETWQLCLPGSFYLPVYVGRTSEFEQSQKKEPVSLEQAKKEALSHFSQFLSDLEENGVRIVDKNVMIDKKKDRYKIYGKLRVCEDITKRVPTEKKEVPESKENQEE